MLVKWCKRGVFAAIGAISMAKIAGISWRYDALSMRLVIREERFVEAWRGVVKKLQTSGGISKKMVRGKTRKVQVRRRDPTYTSSSLYEQSCR
jgi:hypothetical protein